MAKKEINIKKNFYTELNNRYSKPYQKKNYFYFMWRNKLSNSQTDFSEMTEENFINKYLKKKRNGKWCDGKKSYNMLQMWESTDEYQTLMQEYYSLKMNQDFYKLYDKYLEKAMNGDEKALNSLKLIKKEIESLNKVKKSTKKKVEDEEEFDMS